MSKVNYSILHIPTWEIWACESEEQAKETILEQEVSEEFMLLRGTLRDLIIERLVELKNESKSETKFSAFFLLVIDSVYKNLTSKEIHASPKQMETTLIQMSKELHMLKIVYSDELKYEKLIVEELALNLDGWSEKINEINATSVMKAWIGWVQSEFNTKEIKEAEEICNQMLLEKKWIANPVVTELMNKYNDLIWSKDEISEFVSSSLDLKHEETNITIHLQTWLHRFLTV